MTVFGQYDEHCIIPRQTGGLKGGPFLKGRLSDNLDKSFAKANGNRNILRIVFTLVKTVY